MPIKLIAVDMDGTFLNSQKKYNKARFLAQYDQLKRKGIRFVVASGNPLYTLKAYFPEIAHEIAYVAENGAYVVDAMETLNEDAFHPDVLCEVLADLKAKYADQLILCAKDCAYIEKSVSDQTLEKLKIYFSQFKLVDDLTAVKDQICKITLSVQQYHHDHILNDLQHKSYLQEQMVKMVSSGFGFIDFILPNKHKAYGLQILQQKWNIADQEVLAVGDNHNDLEMIIKAGYGFAMSNAVPEVKQVAKYHTRSNEQEAVLDLLDLVLNGGIFSEKSQHSTGSMILEDAKNV